MNHPFLTPELIYAAGEKPIAYIRNHHTPQTHTQIFIEQVIKDEEFQSLNWVNPESKDVINIWLKELSEQQDMQILELCKYRQPFSIPITAWGPEIQNNINNNHSWKAEILKVGGIEEPFNKGWEFDVSDKPKQFKDDMFFINGWETNTLQWISKQMQWEMTRFNAVQNDFWVERPTGRIRLKEDGSYTDTLTITPFDFPQP
jgi:hypothetical protein